MPATLTGANSATSHSADIIIDDQTRSWSSRIAATDDPFVKRGYNMHGNLQNMRVSTRQTRVLGNAVEERRTDGDRHTQMMTATEWLMQKDDKNNLRAAPRGAGPPVLPRSTRRDHLSDRNREVTLYDPANPGVQPQVRVTARNGVDDCSAQGRRRAYMEERQANEERARQLAMERRLEEERAAEANELLELRSMGIRAIIAKNEEHQPGNARSPIVTRAAAKKAAVPPAPTPAEEAAAAIFAAAEEPKAGEPLKGWGRAREEFNPKKPIFIDGKPLSIDLEWITGPLERKIEGFRGSPPKVREAPPPSGPDPWGPVPFSMPGSQPKAHARRAHPIRASG